MSAVVIDLEPLLAARKPRATARAQRPAATDALTHDFTFWRGATGQRYVHTIYSLFECPELPAANVVLVRRHAAGHAEALHIGRVEHDAQSLNLAEIRRSAATIGANEIHVHLLAADAAERAAIEADLSEAGDLVANGTRH